jgi:hypothetical protein
MLPMVVKSGGKNSGGDKPLGVLSLAIRFIHEAREEMNYPSKLRGIDPQRSDPLPAFTGRRAYRLVHWQNNNDRTSIDDRGGASSGLPSLLQDFIGLALFRLAILIQYRRQKLPRR